MTRLPRRNKRTIIKDQSHPSAVTLLFAMDIHVPGRLKRLP